MRKLFFGGFEMKKLFLGLLLVLITINVYAKPITSTSPIAPGVYVDRFTDTAYVFTATSVSYVKWPSGAVIWTTSTAANFANYNNFVIAAHYSMVSTPQQPNEVNTYIPAVTLHYFEFITPKGSLIPTYFPNASTQIAIQFKPVSRNNKVWLDVYYDRKLLDPLGGGYFRTFYKSYAKQ
jgi:hypothetical protein